MNEECNANLKKIGLANQFWARDIGEIAGTSVPVDTDWVPYMTDGKKPRCPSGGIYYVDSVDELPQCTIAGHVLEEPR